MGSLCPICNGPIVHNEAFDACSTCGKVTNMGQLVADVQFESLSGGGSRATGQFVSALRSQRDYSGGNGRLSASGRDSRANTEEKGRVFITSYANTLGLTRLIDAARLLFQSVVQQNFIQGRKTNLVAAACLYIACRRDASSPMMLIDFSPILETNIYEFGQTVMSVRSKLAAELPVIDPVHYIERFAARLSFGQKTQQVANTALQVVRRLSRDWLQTGRRPSGITGVALYIAAHMHGLTPSMADLVNEMHVCDSTLKKRLNEFLDTPAAELPRTDFEGLAEQEFDNVLPPIMRAPRIKSELLDATEDDDADLELRLSAGRGRSLGKKVSISGGDDDDDDETSRSKAGETDDDDDDDAEGSGNGKKPLRRLRRREPSPSDDRRRRKRRESSKRREVGDESSKDAATTDDEASTSRKKRRSVVRTRRRAPASAAAAGASAVLKKRNDSTIDSTNADELALLSIEEVRAELRRRGRTAQMGTESDARHALFVDNVDRQSLLTSLTVADLRALAETRIDSDAPQEVPAALGESTGEPATSLSVPERRRLLDAAQLALRQTIEHDLMMMHETRKQTKAQEVEHQQKMDEQHRLRVAQRDAALTSVAAVTGGQRGGVAMSKKRAAKPEPGDAGADAATTAAASSTTMLVSAPPVATGVVESIVGDGVDEEEIDNYLLTPAEVKLRSQIWHELNKEYLEEQRSKAELEEQLRAQGKQPRKRNNKRREAVSASQAAHEALGRTSSKINYDVLQKLMDPNFHFNNNAKK